MPMEFVESVMYHIDIHGSVQDCVNSSALAIELLQSCSKPSVYVLKLAKI